MRQPALIAALILAALLTTGPAFAQNASGVVYDATKGVVLLASPGAASGAGGANCKAATTGAIRYNSTTPAIEFCNGTQWTASVYATTPPITAPAGNGYFVLSYGTWTGNLETPAGIGSDGLNSGDKLCLTDLTTHTGWMGYATANSNGQLVAGKVHAFLCSDAGGYGTSRCNNLLPLTTYYFANAGNSAAGGAYFTTDNNGLGPYDSNNWAAGNFFSGTYIYKSGRNTSTATVWAGTPYGIYSDNYFDWSTTSWSDDYGISTATDGTRWTSAGSYTEFGVDPAHLICFVNP